MDHVCRRLPLLIVLLGGAAVLGAGADARADALHQEAKELRSRYAAELEELAKWCAEHGLVAQAQATRRRLGPSDPYKLYLPVLPRTLGRPEPPAGTPPDVVEWDRRLAALGRDHAAALYELARRAVRRNQASLAYELVLGAIRTDPDHQGVRRILGYQEHEGQWHTSYEVRKLRAGQVWHEKFGWLPRSYVRRYEDGSRYAGGRWITAAEDAAGHRDILSGWDVETEHYTIRTNDTLEAGVALGTKLERLHELWRQIFIRYYATEADLVALFDGRARSRPAAPRRYDVAFLREREQYVRALRPYIPQVEISVGVYVEQTHRAYFFAGKDYADRTLYHEATHQLFQQSRPVPPGVGRKANFWIVEGIALFMESLREENGYYVLGGFEDERMVAACYRLLNDKFYVPLVELTGFGMEKLQSYPRLPTLYSQMAGLANFLIYFDGGRYRDALVSYLSTVYAGRDTPNTLAELTGTSYPELDKQYRQFIEAGVRAGER